MVVELTNGVAYVTNKFIWDGAELVEQRNNAGTNVLKRFFGSGEQISGTNYYFTIDHLGSIREMVDSTGTIQYRASYDPYGRPTIIQGSVVPDFGYAGMYYEAADGLNLTLYRAYAADLGRWNSRGPMQEMGGLNLYDYVDNNPINGIDPLGLIDCSFVANLISRTENSIHTTIQSMSDIQMDDQYLFAWAAVGEGLEGATGLGFLGYEFLGENAAVDLSSRNVIASVTGKVVRRGHGQSTFYRTVKSSVTERGNLDLASGSETAGFEGGKGMMDKIDENFNEAINFSDQSWLNLISFNPALSIYQAESEMGSDMSESSYQTILVLQTQLENMINIYNTDCCQ